MQPTHLRKPCPDGLNELPAGFDALPPEGRHEQRSTIWALISSPSVLPLQQSSGMKLVGTQLEDTSFSPRRSCREESELLAELLRPTSQVGNQLAVGLEML